MYERGTFSWPVDDERHVETTGMITVSVGALLIVPTLVYGLTQRFAFLRSTKPINNKGLFPLPGVLSARIGPLKLTVYEFLFSLACLTALSVWMSPDAWTERLGNICAALMVLAVFPACRATVLTLFTKLSMERLLKSHRMLGLSVVAIMWAHAGSYYVQWIADGTFWEKCSLYKYQMGNNALYAVTLLFFTSFNWVRRRFFELFYYTHLICWIVIVVFVCLHSPPVLPFLMVATAWWVLDRVVRAGRSVRSVSVVSATTIGPDMVKLVLRTPMAFEAGSYVFLSVPAIKFLQWHPFTISSAHHHGDASNPAGLAANPAAIDALWTGPEADAVRTAHKNAEAQAAAGSTISVHIKTLGDWSTKLKTLVESKKEFSVKLDGPYGALSVPADRYKTLVLISGGVGVTPMLSVLLESWRTMSTKGPTSLKRLHFIWVARDASVVAWFSETLKAISTSNLSSNFLFSIYLSRESAESPLIKEQPGVYRAGRPKEWSEILRDVAKTADKDEKAIGVFTCGPESMTTNVMDVSLGLTLAEAGPAFHCHRETFDF